MKTKKYIKNAVEIVVFIFALFSGTLENIAPPKETNTGIAVGIASFLALIVVLFIKAQTNKWTSKIMEKKNWYFAIFLILLLVILFVYMYSLDILTFNFPPEDNITKYVKGFNYTNEAIKYKKENKIHDDSILVDNFGGIQNINQVWEKKSISLARTILLLLYILLVLSIFFCIVSLVEILMKEPDSSKNIVSDS